MTDDVQMLAARRSQAQAKIAPMVLAVLAGWLVASLVAAAAWSTVARGGLQEDRARRHAIDRG